MDYPGLSTAIRGSGFAAGTASPVSKADRTKAPISSATTSAERGPSAEGKAKRKRDAVLAGPEQIMQGPESGCGVLDLFKQQRWSPFLLGDHVIQG